MIQLQGVSTVLQYKHYFFLRNFLTNLLKLTYLELVSKQFYYIKIKSELICLIFFLK